MIGGAVAIILAGWAVSQLLPANEDAMPRDATAGVAAPESAAAAILPEIPAIEVTAAETASAEPEVPAEAPPAPEPPPVPVCEICPAMVMLPGATFLMGSPVTEAGREPVEGPVREVTLKPFALSKTEVTMGQWRACVEDGGCNGDRAAPGVDDAMPAAAISWKDAGNYVKWLSAKTGNAYRLPTEAEWEYAARAGTDTAYWWGNKFDAAKAPRDKVREAASLPENSFGLQGMLGNVGEWTQDCYVNGYAEAPADGSAVTSGDCSRRVVRGGSVKSSPAAHRSANRARLSISVRDRQYGFRVALSEE